MLGSADIKMNTRGGTAEEGADIYTHEFNMLHYSVMNAMIKMCVRCRADDKHKAELYQEYSSGLDYRIKAKYIWGKKGTSIFVL